MIKLDKKKKEVKIFLTEEQHKKMREYSLLTKRNQSDFIASYIDNFDIYDTLEDKAKFIKDRDFIFGKLINDNSDLKKQFQELVKQFQEDRQQLINIIDIINKNHEEDKNNQKSIYYKVKELDKKFEEKEVKKGFW